jgi:hypothetical protein
MLLRKQTSLNETFHTRMEFDPQQPGYEAGITVWWSQYSYATIGITLVELPDGKRVRTVVFRQPSGVNGAINTIYPLIASDTSEKSAEVASQVDLKIEAQPTSYKLTLLSEGENKEFHFPTRDLTISPPVGCVFAGVLLGLYSVGKGEPVLDPADFSDIYIVDNSGSS